MATDKAVFRSAFQAPSDETAGLGKRPVVFDVLATDWETSLLPDDLKMVLHVNPKSMSVKYERQVERIQTRAGYVEQHWGDKTQSLDFSMSTGGFMRLYSGLSNTTSTKYGGSRRETIAYDKYLDILALFHNNGSVFDSRGNIVFQGIIKLTFDGGVFLGWFRNFTVTEAAEKPFMFELTTTFEVHKEITVWRSTIAPSVTSTTTGGIFSEESQGQQVFPNDL